VKTRNVARRASEEAVTTVKARNVEATSEDPAKTVKTRDAPPAPRAAGRRRSSNTDLLRYPLLPKVNRGSTFALRRPHSRLLSR